MADEWIVLVADVDQGKTLGRGGGAGCGAISGLERRSDTLDGPAAFANQFEGAGESADLMVQEAAGFGHHFDNVAVSCDIKAVERANRRRGLAGGGAEGREVVPAEQKLGGLVHDGVVERDG